MGALPLWIALVAAALAGDRTRESSDADGVRTFRYPAGAAMDSVTFSLPVSALEADLALSGEHPMDALVQARASAVRAWALGRPDLRVEVEVAGNKLKYSVAGPEGGAVRAMETAQRVSEAARARFLETHGYEDANGLIRPAHARLIGQYAAALAPVAAALARPADDPGTFAARALTFVQTIPYERRSEGGDTYRRPLAILDGDRGDCDSKAVLYLSLMRVQFPEMVTALLYIPNHLYVGLELPGAGDRVEIGGRSFLLAEPAGPGLLKLGELDDRHERAAIIGARVVSPVL